MIPTKEAVLPQVGNIDDPWGSWMMWLKYAEIDWTPLRFCRGHCQSALITKRRW